MTTLPKRVIGGKSVHPVGLGCMNVSWAYATPPSEEDASKLLNRALDLGYDNLDTARIYGGGKNEALIGKALKGRRDEFFLSSKCGILVDGPKRGIDCSAEALNTALETSLKLLGTDYIDLYYMHRFDPKVEISECVGALADAVKAGKIGAYGVSEWSSAHIETAHAIHPVGAVQTEYSLWTRNVELAVLETCKRLDIPFVAFSPVGRGALGGVMTDPTKLEETDLRQKMPRFNAENWPHNLGLVEQLIALAQGAGVTSAQLALRWVLEQGDNVHVIPGTTNLTHLEDNYNAAMVDIDADVLSRADAIINHASVKGHRYHDAIKPTIDTEEFEEA